MLVLALLALGGVWWWFHFKCDLSVGGSAQVPYLVQGVYYKNLQARWEKGDQSEDVYATVVQDMRVDAQLIELLRVHNITPARWGYGPDGLIMGFDFKGRKYALYKDGKVVALGNNPFPFRN